MENVSDRFKVLALRPIPNSQILWNSGELFPFLRASVPCG